MGFAARDTIPTAHAIVRVGDLQAIFSTSTRSEGRGLPERELLDLQAEKMRVALKG